jgi:hypothetical protein
MKKLMIPTALLSAAAIVAACSNEGPTSPSSASSLSPKTPSFAVGIASAGEAQICLDGTAPATNTYSVALSYGGDVTGDITLGSPQPITPGNCIPALTNGGPDGLSSPVGNVTSTITVNEVGGSWAYSCLVDPSEGTPTANFCPLPATGSTNTATSGMNAYHGSTLTYSYTPAPVVHTNGCSYSQGYYKTHATYTTSALAAGGTYIVGGKLDVSGGLDRNLATTADNTLTAAQVVNNLNPKNAEAAMRQLITAELNVARGATTTSTVDAAITGLRNYYAGTSATKAQVSAWTTTLDNFNNGLIPGAAAHCGDE